MLMSPSLSVAQAQQADSGDRHTCCVVGGQRDVGTECQGRVDVTVVEDQHSGNDPVEVCG